MQLLFIFSTEVAPPVDVDGLSGDIAVAGEQDGDRGNLVGCDMRLLVSYQHFTLYQFVQN